MTSRRFLSLEEKVEVIHFRSRNKASVRVLAEHFRVGKTQIADILKNKNQILKRFRENAIPDDTSRVFQGGQGAILDKEVLEWFHLARSLHIPLKGPMVQAKAVEIADKLNMKGFKASNGWLNRFRIRHKIEFKTYNESISIGLEKDKEWVSKIRKIVQDFSSRDVFNAVKTVLCFRAIPEKKRYSEESIGVGGKVPEKFLTLFLCASMTGEKLTPLVVWEGKNPRCLKGVTQELFGVSWKCVSKLWMTTDIVSDWFRDLDKEMKFQNRKILLFIDNTISHPHINLENIQLVFFPSNLTSTSQPLNQSVVKNFKVKYRILLLNHLIANLDHSFSPQELSKSVNILQAIAWVKNALNAILPGIVKNSFIAAGFPSDGKKDEAISLLMEEELAHLSKLIKILEMDMDADEYSQIEEILGGRNNALERQIFMMDEDSIAHKLTEVESHIKSYAEGLHIIKKLKDFYETEKDLEGYNLIEELLIHHEKKIVDSKNRFFHINKMY